MLQRLAAITVLPSPAMSSDKFISMEVLLCKTCHFQDKLLVIPNDNDSDDNNNNNNNNNNNSNNN